MDQFNSASYKKKNLLQEFFHSCLGRIVIFLLVLLGLYIFAIITRPSNKMMLEETLDNIHECLQDNDSIKGDEIDEVFHNIARTISTADTTQTNPELYKAFKKYNQLEVYNHGFFKTVHVINGIYPQGRRISIGFFQTVISTLSFEDLVVNTGAARGDFNKRLNAPPVEHEEEDDEPIGDLNVEPYHYQGDPEN